GAEPGALYIIYIIRARKGTGMRRECGGKGAFHGDVLDGKLLRAGVFFLCSAMKVDATALFVETTCVVFGNIGVVFENNADE
ncbi:MAG: hypothetical protein IJV06_11650, partial [Bacteroidaceae bacterium]|nr:hypothetical protein [Bacteroidaceae bacterium]